MQGNIRDTRSIEDIMNLIDQKKLVLPAFQRDFKWPLEKIEILFDSIFKDLFIGSLIISKPEFDLACRGLDLRSREKKIRRSQKKEEARLYTQDYFYHNDIYGLLDGQQRVTSIYRALKGIDKIYIIFKNVYELVDESIWDSSQERIKKKCQLSGEKININFSQYIDRVTAVKPDSDIFYQCLGDIYEKIDEEQDDFEAQVIFPVLNKLNFNDSDKIVYKRYAVKFWNDFKTEVYKRKNLISVQLLNMDLERFCLYFERSNSQGLNLSFTDIITAKIYIDFKLGDELKKLEKEEYFPENMVDYLVRYINFKVNGDVTKKSILKKLDGHAFEEHWDDAVKDIIHLQKWLEDNHWVFDVSNIPYKTMLLPLLSFLQNLPNKDFSQATTHQISVLKVWFYASMYDNRYGGARHGSTNVVLKKDCEILRDLAINKKIPLDYWDNFKIEFKYEEFLNIHVNNNTKFLTVNYLMWNAEKFRNLENNAIISISQKIDVHHIYPIKYIEKNFEVNSFECERFDSVLNKVRINKISNIKIKDKAPSAYLNEILLNNIDKDADGNNIPETEIDAKNNLIKCLETHCIPFSEDLLNGICDGKFVNGSSDGKFEDFLKARYQLFEKYLQKLSDAHLNLKTGQSQIW